MRQASLRAVYALAQRDPRVIFIGSDIGVGTLADMQAEFPERYFMEAVSEQHLIGMAAGLAMEGFIPYINTIATFLTRRCFEQIALDLCLPRLPVRLLGSGGGAVYAPLGPTHIACDDLAILRALPNMTIVAPVDAPEMSRLMEGSLNHPGPMYIRLAKGGDPIVSTDAKPFAIGRAIAMRPGGDVALVSTGVMTTRALAAAELLARQGVEAGVLHVHTVKPLDMDALRECAIGRRLVVTIEEHTRIGGLGSAVSEAYHDMNLSVPIVRLGFPDVFTAMYGSQDSTLEEYGLQPPQIAASTLDALGRRPLAIG